MNSSTFLNARVTLTVGSADVDGERLRSGRGWLRRLAPESWSDASAAGSLTDAKRGAAMAALAAVVLDDSIRWLTPVTRLGRGENKIVQYRLAHAMGLPVPEWRVTTDPDRAPADPGWVSKPIGPGSFLADDGNGMIVPTTRFDPATRSAVAGAPFLFQRMVCARRHARVVTVGSEVHSGTLDAVDLPMDWRLAARAHVGFGATAAPAYVCAHALQLAGELGVGYSSQDWIEDQSGDWWFVDLNPAGQWLFLPDAVSMPITQAIADFLDGAS
jgi:hypothetical protein